MLDEKDTLFLNSLRPTIASIIWYNLSATIDAHYLFSTYSAGDQLAILYNNVGNTCHGLLRNDKFPKDQIEHYAWLFLNEIIREKNISKIDKITKHINKRVHEYILRNANV